jgi:hypothetical protein
MLIEIATATVENKMHFIHGFTCRPKKKESEFSRLFARNFSVMIPCSHMLSLSWHHHLSLSSTLSTSLLATLLGYCRENPDSLLLMAHQRKSFFVF